jgi:hypothetical protein
MTTLYPLAARGIRIVFDAAQGQLARFEVLRGERILSPFARVPWADTPDPGFDLPEAQAHLRRMSGDFFCAPFCIDDVSDGPFHGWSANAAWDLVDSQRLPDGFRARFRLSHTIAGAVVEKIWVLRDDHPFLYQRHDFIGGAGAIPVAHHAMIDLRTGGDLRFSPKLWAETPSSDIQPGRSVLAYPGRSKDLTAFPGKTGPVNLTRYPIGLRHEDFAMLVDDPAERIGWATATRPAYGDAAILMKRVSVLPQTMLWLSNGGRDAAPWSGRHVGVLGIEDACALAGEGWSAAIAPNRLTDQGIPTAINLAAAPVVSIATVMGAVPTGSTRGLTLKTEGDNVVFSDGSSAPFDAAWLD